MCPGNLVEPASGSRELTGREREPRQEGEPLTRTDIHEVIRAAVSEIVAVLDRHDVGDVARPRELVGRDVADADVADAPRLLQLNQHPNRLLDRDLRVDGVQLVEIDPLEAKAPKAGLARRAQVRRTAVGTPLVGAVPEEAALGGDDEVSRVRVQGVGDQQLRNLGSVGVGRVDQVHAEFKHTAQQSLGSVAIRRLAPYAAAGDAHSPVAQPADREITAEHVHVCGGHRMRNAGHGRLTSRLHSVSWCCPHILIWARRYHSSPVLWNFHKHPCGGSRVRGEQGSRRW
jgi:hypothetical protein